MHSKTGVFTILFASTLFSSFATFPAETLTVVAQDEVLLPDGALFPLWDDQTAYRQIYHVAGQDPQAVPVR